MVALALEEASYMASLRPQELGISPQALDTITSYVRSPTQVARMVTLGHALAQWLDTQAGLQTRNATNGNPGRDF